MGVCWSKTDLFNQDAIDGGKTINAPGNPLSNIVKTALSESEIYTIKDSLNSVLVFERLDNAIKDRIISNMYLRYVQAGQVIIQQDAIENGADEMYVIKEGTFDVFLKRKGIVFKTHTKRKGECFGESGLLYNSPRPASVIAACDGAIWVLTRECYFNNIKEANESNRVQLELFVNSVPILEHLPKESLYKILDAFEIRVFSMNDVICKEGDACDTFYIIKEGEVEVLKDDEVVNTLFQSEFFGEKAILANEPHDNTIRVVSNTLVALTLQKNVFQSILGPYQEAINKQVNMTSDRITKIRRLSNSGRSTPNTSCMRFRKTISLTMPDGEILLLSGHVDEVNDLTNYSDKPLEFEVFDKLGSGAFSVVFKVKDKNTEKLYAMKRMDKIRLIKCSDHVYNEQMVTSNLLNQFCIRQYASFQDNHYLYMLLDFMDTDLMAVLMSDCKLVKSKFLTNEKVWKGISEHNARFYVGCVVLGLEYLHNQKIVYRDLKPENVLIDKMGYARLGDFGMAKILQPTIKSYTFCGTPGYIAPEIINGKGYSHSVDWWSLGVFIFVILTATQPFDNPHCIDPMDILARISNDSFEVKYPEYLSHNAKDIINKLLNRKPHQRLGVLVNKTDDIKNHAWFDGFDWKALASRSLEAPITPSQIKKTKVKIASIIGKANASRIASKKQKDLMRRSNKIFENF
jgi:cGMP-dependent protein kinase 2